MFTRKTKTKPRPMARAVVKSSGVVKHATAVTATTSSVSFATSMVQAAIGLKGQKKKGGMKKSKSMEFQGKEQEQPGTKSTATLTGHESKPKKTHLSKLKSQKSPPGTLTKTQTKELQQQIQASKDVASPKTGQRVLGHDRNNGKIAIVVDNTQERKNSLGSGSGGSGSDGEKDKKRNSLGDVHSVNNTNNNNTGTPTHSNGNNSSLLSVPNMQQTAEKEKNNPNRKGSVVQASTDVLMEALKTQLQQQIIQEHQAREKAEAELKSLREWIEKEHAQDQEAKAKADAEIKEMKDKLNSELKEISSIREKHEAEEKAKKEEKERKETKESKNIERPSTPLGQQHEYKTLHITVKCRNLISVGFSGDCDPVVALFDEDGETHYLTYLAQTEWKRKTYDPQFETSFEVAYEPGTGQIIRFHVYHMSDTNSVVKIRDHPERNLLGWVLLKADDLLLKPNEEQIFTLGNTQYRALDHKLKKKTSTLHLTASIIELAFDQTQLDFQQSMPPMRGPSSSVTDEKKEGDIQPSSLQAKRGLLNLHLDVDGMKRGRSDSNLVQSAPSSPHSPSIKPTTVNPSTIDVRSPLSPYPLVAPFNRSSTPASNTVNFHHFAPNSSPKVESTPSS